MTLTITPNSSAAPADGATYRERAHDLLPLLKAEAPAIEAARELTPAVIEALIDNDMFQMLLAPARGHVQLGVEDAVTVLETLATGDASTAWDVMAAIGGCFLSGFIDASAATAIFATPADVAATAVGRIGKAISVEGGYLVEAQWPFLSGSPHASWVGGLCMVHDGEGPRLSPGGQPHIVVPFIRKERVQMLDTWNATGLRGTGSHDALAVGVFVPSAQVADLARGPRPELPLLFSIDENSAAPLCAASIGVGAARAAAEWFRETMRERHHQSGVFASEAPLPRLALAESEARLQRASTQLRALAADLDAELAAGRLPDAVFIARVSLAATAAMEDAIDVVSNLYRAAGSSAVFTGSVIERSLRDVFTLGAHRMVQRENYLVHARDSSP